MAEEERLENNDARRLARMLQVAAGSGKVWEASELSVILQHQLTASVQFDVESVDPELAELLEASLDERAKIVRAFGELFTEPNPPVELLELTKRFARACGSHPDSLLPREVALVLYYTSIVVALVRCGRRITNLDDIQLVNGLRWLLTQEWVGEPVRSILTMGLRKIAG